MTGICFYVDMEGRGGFGGWKKTRAKNQNPHKKKKKKTNKNN